MSELLTVAARMVADTATAKAVPATLPPDDLAAARFNAIMQPAQAAPADATGTVAPLAGADGVAAGKTASLGDTVLRGMQNLSTEFKQTFDWVRGALDGQVSMNDMLKLQIGITQSSLKYDLVGKAIGRSTQNLDQLVKMQ